MIMLDFMSLRRSRARLPLLRLFAISVILSLLLIPGGTFAESGSAARASINIQILDISDWHGQLDPVSITGVGNVGGAAALSAYFQADRAANPNTLTLTAGDAVGATPPLSNYFNDEPAILAMNLMGIQVDTFGNHNFDGGVAHLQDLIDLADFQFVSANLQNRDANLTGVKDFEIFELGGVKIAIIGITNPEAPTLVFPGSFGTMTPTDPVKAALKARNAAKDAGAEIVVVICHLGVTSFDLSGAPAGPLIDFAKAVNKPNNVKIDLIIGDHTDVQYSGVINGALVVENKSKGATYAKINLSVDTASHRILNQTATFVVPVAGAVTPDPAIVAMLAPYRTALAAILDTPVAVATDLFPRGGTPSVERSGEAALGDLVADSLRLKYGTQLALTNAGGIRASLPSSYAPLDTSLRRLAPPYVVGPPYDIVIGDVFAVLPFGNTVVTRTVTGAQLWAALENGVSQISAVTCTGADGRFPQISGFKFTFKCSNPAGSRVLSVSLTDNTPILADSTTYTFTTNNFVNAGGDFYAMLNDGQGTTRENMFDVTLEYIQGLGTITPTLDGRITKVP
jgi:5'-nucleotidase